ncbi:MAG: bifunctional glutamate N-acetyltransferase/amino-acid acetyltransferase ArgJ [Pseudomonadota bacterium]
MYPVKGIQLGISKAGIKYPDRKDLLLIKADVGTTIAGVFTQNSFCAAPVHICKDRLHSLDPKQDIYLLVNTGNANAGTGEQGMLDAFSCTQAIAEKVDCKVEQVFPFSTGVIGENLPVDKVISGLDAAINDLKNDNWVSAAEAILTTDTVPKMASKQLQLQGQTVSISGISKGSGMIRPDMATMLAYITTDLAIERNQLQHLVKQMADKSFNRITVDGDTSTNDSCMLLATGQTANFSKLSNPETESFIEALTDVFEDLAKAIVLDGEGATKLITIDVQQGENEQECLDVAYTVAHSPLVKTAFFASDPNWGRILAAVGRSGLDDFDINAIEIFLGDVCIVRNGGRAATYLEQDGQQVMDQDHITIRIALARGDVSSSIWTCDFSYDYVKINAEYRT